MNKNNITHSRNFDENFTLSGKTAIITGAASGIGLEIARMFARKGADIVAVDLRNSSELEDYVQSMNQKYLSAAVDLAAPGVIDEIISNTLLSFHKIDILVNCAGVGILEPALHSTDDTWDLTLSVNLKYCVKMSIAAGRIMIRQGYGSIINMASQAGIVAIENHLAYGCSKAGLIQATRQLALEWGRYGVRINAISPEVILTPMGEMNWNNEKGEAFKALIPSRRFGYPEEVAACAVYLASDASSLFNGANLVIDGGYTIQ